MAEPVRWTVREETRRVVYLYRNGEVIQNADGKPEEYGSHEEAWYIAENWDTYGAPPLRTLRDLSDDELHERIRRLAQADALRP